MRVRRQGQILGGASMAVVALLATAVQAKDMIAVLDATQSTWSSTRRSVVFYDPAVSLDNPQFAVFCGYEDEANFDDPSAITVDPQTGDVYVISYDSGTEGVPDAEGDTQGDFDLYRIDFDLVYDAWEDPQGNNGAYAFFYTTEDPPFNPRTAVPGDPYYPSGVSNPVQLDFCIRKIGEVARNQDGPFYDVDLEFVNPDTLILLDNQTGADCPDENPCADDDPANDHVYRALNRRSMVNGDARPPNSPADGGPPNWPATGAHEGGWNGGTAESWESFILRLVNMDLAEGAPVGRSEPVDISYHLGEEPIEQNGVEGVWVLESDGGGDDVSFLQITNYFGTAGNDYRTLCNDCDGTDDVTGITLDNDPEVDPTTNDGSGDWIIVDSNTGHVWIGESGYFDGTTFGVISTGAHEPKFLHREIVTYEDGSNRIQTGGWLTEGPMDVEGNVYDDDPDVVVDGRFVTLDEDDLVVHLFDIDSGSVPDVTSDAYEYDLLDPNPTTATTLAIDGDNGPNHFIERHGVRWFDAPVDPPMPAVLLWESVKEHGGGPQPVDQLAITLDHTAAFAVQPPPATTSVEPRRFEATGKEDKDFIVITFDTDISALHQPGNVVINVSGPNPGTLAVASETVGGANNEQLVLELTLSGATQNFEAYCVTIDVSGSVAGITGDGDCNFRVQYGNVAGGSPPDLATNLIDFGEVKTFNGVNVVDPNHPNYDATKAGFDWNLDGAVNLIDAGEVKSRNGRSSLVAGCP